MSHVHVHEEGGPNARSAAPEPAASAPPPGTFDPTLSAAWELFVPAKHRRPSDPAFLASLGALFPDVDLAAELREVASHDRARPPRRRKKSSAGFRAAAETWVRRSVRWAAENGRAGADAVAELRQDKAEIAELEQRARQLRAGELEGDDARATRAGHATEADWLEDSADKARRRIERRRRA